MELFHNLIYGFGVALSWQNMLYCMLGVSDVHPGVAVSVMLLMALAMFAAATVLVSRGIGIKD